MTAAAPVKRQRPGIDHSVISVSIPGETATETRQLATRRNVTVSSVVAAALRMYLNVIADRDDDRAA